MQTRLEAARSALAANDQTSVRGQYTAFASAFGSTGPALAQLYPTRCLRLTAAKAQADAAILSSRLDEASVGPPLAPLQAGLASVGTDLNPRIQAQSPDRLVGGSEESAADTPSVTGSPRWDSMALRIDADEGSMKLYQRVQGQPNALKIANLVPAALARWHELKLVVSGGGTHVAGYLDTQKFLETDVDTPVSGPVGVWAKTDTIVLNQSFAVDPN
jgi:hypothetical protein